MDDCGYLGTTTAALQFSAAGGERSTAVRSGIAAGLAKEKSRGPAEDDVDG